MAIHAPSSSPSSSTSAKAEAKSPVAVAAAAAAKKKTGKQNKKPKGLGKAARRSNKKRRQESYGSYIHRVLKQVHPEAGISKKAMVVMDDMVKHLFERIATEAKGLFVIQKAATKNGLCTFTAKDVQSAVALVLPGELAKHGASEGKKAVTLFLSNTQKPKKPQDE